MRRSANVLDAGCVNAWLGIASMSEASFCAATSAGKAARDAASFQGSRFILPRMEASASGAPLRSSPRGSNRNAAYCRPGFFVVKRKARRAHWSLVRNAWMLSRVYRAARSGR